jgi:hypothetical protein
MTVDHFTTIMDFWFFRLLSLVIGAALLVLAISRG